MIVKLLYKLKQKEVTVQDETGCAELKEKASEFANVPAQHLNLLFRGRPLQDNVTLKAAGIKNGSKINVMETGKYVETQAMAMEAAQKLRNAQAKETEEQDKMITKVQEIKSTVDELQQEVETLFKNGLVASSTKPAGIIEMLTQQLLQLDNLDLSGEARDLRRSLIKRINHLCDRVEALKQSHSGQ